MSVCVHSLWILSEGVETAPLFRLSRGFSTAEVAQRCGLSFRQLDYFVRHGVLEPSGPARGSGSYRVWSEGDLLRARLVARLRSLGAPLVVLAGVVAQLPADPEEWPPFLFVSPDGQVRELSPVGEAWWGVNVGRLRSGEPEGSAAPAA